MRGGSSRACHGGIQDAGGATGLPLIIAEAMEPVKGLILGQAIRKYEERCRVGDTVPASGLVGSSPVQLAGNLLKVFRIQDDLDPAIRASSFVRIV